MNTIIKLFKTLVINIRIVKIGKLLVKYEVNEKEQNIYTKSIPSSSQMKMIHIILLYFIYSYTSTTNDLFKRCINIQNEQNHSLERKIKLDTRDTNIYCRKAGTFPRQ